MLGGIMGLMGITRQNQAVDLKGAADALTQRSQLERHDAMTTDWSHDSMDSYTQVPIDYYSI